MYSCMRVIKLVVEECCNCNVCVYAYILKNDFNFFFFGYEMETKLK